jgi:predicted dehydrogenase
MDKNVANIWLVGTGLMGIEYSLILKELNVPFLPIGRGPDSALEYQNQIGVKPIQGGLSNFLLGMPNIPSAVIVAVGVDLLTDITLELLCYGVKKILVEKPGVSRPVDIERIAAKTEAMGAEVYVAYNRRFYASVREAQKIIELDGGVTSFLFEFTEWSHLIAGLTKPTVEFETWFLCNSTHVVDTAFFLGGKPKDIVCFKKGGLPWHPTSSIFSGAGISENDALFSYSANWESPGRWVIEVCTSKHRLIFKPLEKLKIQKIGSVEVEDVFIDDELDVKYKPGFYVQLKNFLEGNFSQLCSIQDQGDLIKGVYKRMSGY